MENTLLGFLYAIAGMLIGGLATHFLSKDIHRRNNFNQAADEFFAAFKNELTRLKSESTPTYDIINPALLKHLEACIVFRRYLKVCERERFKLAQHKYYFSPISPDNNKTEQKYQDERTAIVERIEKLLDFAKFK